MSNKIDSYSFADIKTMGLTDEQILELLKKNWNYLQSQPIIVFGQVSKVNIDLSSFWVIENFYHHETMERLLYPIHHEENIKQTIYIGQKLNGRKLKLKDQQWVHAITHLAPKTEREKHNNPFELAVKEISLLEQLPTPINIEIFGNNDVKLIQKQWYNILHDQVEHQVKSDILNATNELSILKKNVEAKENHLYQIKLEIDDLNNQQAQLKTQFENYQTEVSVKMN